MQTLTEKEVFSLKINWNETDDVDFPYTAMVNNHKWVLRLNDFPEEPLFTLFIDDEEWGHFDDWSPVWKR
jgi:hypothetical protein